VAEVQPSRAGGDLLVRQEGQKCRLRVIGGTEKALL